jgi:hypothetical protein
MLFSALAERTVSAQDAASKWSLQTSADFCIRVTDNGASDVAQNLVSKSCRWPAFWLYQAIGCYMLDGNVDANISSGEVNVR